MRLALDANAILSVVLSCSSPPRATLHFSVWTKGSPRLRVANHICKVLGSFHKDFLIEMGPCSVHYEWIHKGQIVSN